MRALFLTAYLAATFTDVAPVGCGCQEDYETHPYQKPIDIEVQNAAETPFYVDLSKDENAILSCKRDDQSDCLLFNPFCTRDCTEVSADESCDNNLCDPFPRVRKVDKDHPLTLAFDGNLKEKNDHICDLGGICFELAAMEIQQYTLTLHTFDSYTCLNEDCELEDNIVEFASPSGEKRDHTVMFNAPHNDIFEIVVDM